MEHGMVDMVVSRLELKSTIARLLKIMTRQPANTDAPVAAPSPKKPEADSKAA
jgi:acetyl-CoA carboxylase carboxyl transferase subunit beta